MNFRMQLNTVAQPNPPLISEANEIKVELCTHNRTDSPHWHDCAQIWYTRSGSYTHYLNDRPYILPQGSLILVPPFARHYIDTLNSEKTEILCCSFYLKNFCSHITENGDIPLFMCRDMNIQYNGAVISPVTHFYGENRVFSDSAFSSSFDMYKNGGISAAPVIARLLMRVLSLVPQLDTAPYDKFQLRTVFEQLNSIIPVTIFMRQNFSKVLHIKDVFTIAMMSEPMFYKVFKKITGVTFSTYMSLMRISVACRMLTITAMSLDEIAEQTGFSHKSHLIRTCFPLLEFSPTQYRIFSREWFARFAPQWLDVDLSSHEYKHLS